MKKTILLFAALVMIFTCSCNGTPTSTDTVKNIITPGDKISLRGVGTATFEKICTTIAIMPTVKCGSYIKPESEDICYIDMVFRFTNGKTAVNCNEIAKVSAVGLQSNEKYTQYICAAEDENNRNVEANVQIAANANVTFHIALLIPTNPIDMDYAISLYLGKTEYVINYTLNDYIDSSKSIKVGQSFSDKNVKVVYNGSNYSDKLYDNSPDVSDCDEEYVYLTSEFEVTNKGLENTSLESLLSVCAIYDSECYKARYLIEDSENKGSFVPAKTIEGMDTKKVIAVIDLPVGYSQLDAKIVMATDYNEFSYTLNGTNDIFEKREQKKQYLEEMERIRQQEQEQKRIDEQNRKVELESQQQEQAEIEQTDDISSKDDVQVLDTSETIVTE